MVLMTTYFNSHPHEEDDETNDIVMTVRENFNSHPHEEDDGIPFVQWRLPSLFQFTSSRRG